MKKKSTKRALTLLEIMIVIFLITLITGTIGYNMKGTLDRGRAFRTEQAKEQLHDLLLICVEEREKPEDVAKYPARFIQKYNLAKSSEKIVKDGWGADFQIRHNPTTHDFEIDSPAYQRYKDKINPKSMSGAQGTV
jgi:general secretion pathway protein G